MARSHRLVLEHLEDISWKTLADYPDIIRDMIRHQSGIYALYRKNKLYYVGLASNLMGRLKQHLRDRHHGSWDRFSVYLTVEDEHMKELESLLLRIASPPGNKQSGKFRKSQSLLPQLNKTMKERDADRRATLLGGRLVRARRRAKIANAHPLFPLEGAVDRATRLRGERGGWEYWATLRKDGTIRYGDEVFDTPNAAGRAATKGRCNGWTFWRYREKIGEWVPLKNLKG